jgi:hypothetical protein
MPKERDLGDNIDNLGRRVSQSIHHTLYSVRDIQSTHFRKFAAEHLTSKLLFPTELVDKTEDGTALAKAHEMREEGYAFIVPYNHFSTREPLDVMTTLVSLGEGFEDADYLSPLAYHQNRIYTRLIARATDVDLEKIVTTDTVRKGKNKELLSVWQRAHNFYSHNKVQPKELSAGYGQRPYIENGSDVLAAGGIVPVAPQGGRRKTLGEPAGRAVEMLVRAAKRKGMENIAIWPLGISLKEVKVYDQTTEKFNFGKVAEVAFREPLTVEEMQQRAQESSTSEQKVDLDHQVFIELAQLLPPEYTSSSAA